MHSFLRAAALGLIVIMQPFQLGWAQSSADESGIREAITRQLDAMRLGDSAKAFAVASPAIQTMFHDAATFMEMVENGYSELVHSSHHKFLKLDIDGGTLTERVLIESQSGTVVARYEMVQIDGIWRINGCTLEARVDA